jgi:hypothetical protein
MVSSSFADVLAFICPSVRVGIVGSRCLDMSILLSEFIGCLPDGCCVVSGRGGLVDIFAADYADAYGYSVDEFPADWHRYGRSAGPIRNREIVRSGLYCLVVFLSLDGASKGSRDAIKAAKKAGIPVFVFDQKGNSVVSRVREQLALF